MVRFKYMGEIARDYVTVYGPCLQIKIPLKNGDKMVLSATDQNVGFVVGNDIGVEVTDERSLRFLRADSRFEEIV